MIYYLYLHSFFIQFFGLIPKINFGKLRVLWEEKPSYYVEREGEEEKSINEYCKGFYTDYKYNIFYEVGKNYTFTEKNLIENNKYNAVSIIHCQINFEIKYNIGITL